MRLYNDKYTIVTGGSGFIGSGLITELNRRGVDKIVIVDEFLSDVRWKNMQGKKYVELLHKTQLMPWLQGRESEVESVFHLGACSSTTERNVDFLIENNYRYTRTLIEYALKNDLKVAIASSAATYGDGSLGFSDDHLQIESLRPLNPYGFSKQAVDLWLLRDGLLGQVLSLKYFNIFGPNEWHKGSMASRIMPMVAEIQNMGTVSLFESYDSKYPHGGQKRDFLYVKDAVCATVELVEAGAKGIFNIGSGVATTWNALAEAVFQSLGLPVDIKYIPMPAELRGQYQYYTQAKIDKLVRALGRVPYRYTLQQAVSDYVSNHLLPGAPW